MISAERQIENLIYQYAERLDAGDIDGVGELLGSAKVTGGDGNIISTDGNALAKIYKSMIIISADGTPLTHHVTSNVIIEMNEMNLATARSYFTVFQATDELPLQPVIAGKYSDKFASTDGKWHFTHRQIIMTLKGNLSHHLKQ